MTALRVIATCSDCSACIRSGVDPRTGYCSRDNDRRDVAPHCSPPDWCPLPAADAQRIEQVRETGVCDGLGVAAVTIEEMARGAAGQSAIALAEAADRIRALAAKVKP